MKDVWKSIVMDSGEQYVMMDLVLLKHLSFVDNLITLTTSNINTSKGKVFIYSILIFYYINIIDLVILHCQYGLMSSTVAVLLVTVFSPVNNVLMLHYMIVITLKMDDSTSSEQQTNHPYVNVNFDVQPAGPSVTVSQSHYYSRDTSRK